MKEKLLKITKNNSGIDLFSLANMLLLSKKKKEKHPENLKIANRDTENQSPKNGIKVIYSFIY